MKTILAIQPDARQIGYAVFKESELVDFGAKCLGFKTSLAYRLHRVGMPFFRILFETHNPHVVVLPKPNVIAGSGRNRFLRAVSIEMDRWPNAVASFNRRDIQQVFGSHVSRQRLCKDVTMETLTQWFPQLGRYLPKPRRPWDSEDYWVPMFDAVSLAITYLHHDD